jgi:hypothetical protein
MGNSRFYKQFLKGYQQQSTEKNNSTAWVCSNATTNPC